MSESKQTKWVPGLSVYLGDKEQADRRRTALNQIAESLGVDRSKLIRMIADGQLIVIARPPDLHNESVSLP